MVLTDPNPQGLIQEQRKTDIAMALHTQFMATWDSHSTSQRIQSYMFTITIESFTLILQRSFKRNFLSSYNIETLFFFFLLGWAQNMCPTALAWYIEYALVSSSAQKWCCMSKRFLRMRAINHWPDELCVAQHADPSPQVHFSLTQQGRKRKRKSTWREESLRRTRERRAVRQGFQGMAMELPEASLRSHTYTQARTQQRKPAAMAQW